MMFEIGYVRFLDLCQFLSASLADLVYVLLKSGREKFVNTKKYLGDYDLVFAKGIYPYSYMTSPEKIQRNQTPTDRCILRFVKRAGTGPKRL